LKGGREDTNVRLQSCCEIDCHHSLAAHPIGLQSEEDIEPGLREKQKKSKTKLQRQKKSTKARNTARHRSRLSSTSRKTPAKAFVQRPIREGSE
jgi:hypothetical protein